MDEPIKFKVKFWFDCAPFDFECFVWKHPDDGPAEILDVAYKMYKNASLPAEDHVLKVEIVSEKWGLCER